VVEIRFFSLSLSGSRPLARESARLAPRNNSLENNLGFPRNDLFLGLSLAAVFGPLISRPLARGLHEFFQNHFDKELGEKIIHPPKVKGQARVAEYHQNAGVCENPRSPCVGNRSVLGSFSWVGSGGLRQIAKFGERDLQGSLDAHFVEFFDEFLVHQDIGVGGHISSKACCKPPWP